MSGAAAERMPTERAAFAAWTSERARYGDTDRQGHVNNAVFSTFFESGRVAFLMDPAGPLAPAGHGFVIAHIAIDYLRELRWGATVEIGSAVVSLGRTSFVVRQALFQDGACAATARSILVLMDESTRRPAPLPAPVRAGLGALIVTETQPPG